MSTSTWAALSGPRFYYGWWVAFACAAVILLTAGTFFYGFSLLVKPLEEAHRFELQPGSLSAIEFRGPRTQLSLLNDLCHLG